MPTESCGKNFAKNEKTSARDAVKNLHAKKNSSARTPLFSRADQYQITV